MKQQSNLYRESAIKQSIMPDDGVALHLKALPFRTYTYFVCLFCALAVVFLVLGEYRVTESVPGILLPDSGTSKVYAAGTGVLKDLRVTEGNIVTEGESLFSVYNPKTINKFENYTDALIKEIKEKISLSLREKNVKSNLSSFEEQRIKLQIGALNEKLRGLTTQVNNELKHHQILADEVQILEAALKSANGVTSKFLYQQKERERLVAFSNFLANQVDVDHTKNQIKELELELNRIPMMKSLNDIEIEQQISQLNQQLIQLRVTKEHQIKSPIDGVVTAILLKEGDYVTNSTPVMTILQKDSNLSAELYVSSQASGFIELNQTVLIKYRAFPYQKFGVHRGEITEISETIIDPRELSVPLILPEATYRVKVKLDSQTVQSFGNDVRLKAGMLIDAEIVRDKRSILQWLLEPLYSIGGSN